MPVAALVREHRNVTACGDDLQAIYRFRAADPRHILEFSSRWPDAPEDAGWSLGTDLAYLRELVAYWADGFDWPAQEARMVEIREIGLTEDFAVTAKDMTERLVHHLDERYGELIRQYLLQGGELPGGKKAPGPETPPSGTEAGTRHPAPGTPHPKAGNARLRKRNRGPLTFSIR